MTAILNIGIEFTILQVKDEMTGDTTFAPFLFGHLINSWPLGVSDGIMCGVLHFGHALYLKAILQSE